MYRIIAVLSLVVFAGAAAAISFAYEVKVNNALGTTVTMKVRQYHAPTFDGTRPAEWSEDLLIETHEFELTPGQSKGLEFSDASGGFWIVWTARDYGTGKQICSGEIMLATDDAPHRVEVSTPSCVR